MDSIGRDKLCPTLYPRILNMNSHTRPCYGVLRLSPSRLRQARQLWEPVEMAPRARLIALVPFPPLPAALRRERRPLAA